MTIKVRIFGYLTKRSEGSYTEERTIRVPSRCTLEALLDEVGIEQNEDVIFFVNNRIAAHRNEALREHDKVWIYPVMGDG